MAIGLLLAPHAAVPVAVDEFAPGLRADPELAAATTTILMLSSSGQPGDGARCRELGITGYLTKPINPKFLLKQIDQALKDRKA